MEVWKLIILATGFFFLEKFMIPYMVKTAHEFMKIQGHYRAQES
jgi:hypothetical protein